MTEKFAFYGSFRNRSTVDGKVLSVAAETVLVDYLRDILLADTAFARNQHRKVRRGHGDSHLEGPVEVRVVPDDVEFILQSL